MAKKREQLDQQGNSAKAGLAYFDRASSPICGGLRSKLIIVDGVTTHKEQITRLLSSATSSSARYAALIVRQSPTPSKPSSCVRMLQGTWATISAVSSRNCLPLLAMPSPAPLIAPPRDVRASASKGCMNCWRTRLNPVSRVPNSPPPPAQRLNIEKEFVGRRYLDVDFMREQVVIWNYVYTWTVCQARGRLGQDHSEMGPPGNLARETNDYQPAVLY